MIERTGNAERLNQRREHLVSNVTNVMLQKGFHKTTIRDMAAAAGWSMGQLYFYVTRKEDVLFLIAEDIMDDLFGSLQGIKHGESTAATLRETAKTFFDACQRRHREIQLLYRETASMLPHHQVQIKDYELRQRNVFVGLLTEGVEKGEFRPVHVETFAETIIILAHTWILKGWALRDSTSFDEFKSTMLGVLFSSLLTGGDGANLPAKKSKKK